jgi:4-amino-4-deoxy-L-arabinose transferase-like glycosyltransferase
VVLLVCLVAVTFLLRLGAEPLTSPNEGLYGEVAREMLESGDFVVPHINSVVYFEKPPLLYWLAAASMVVLGKNATAARLPSALAGIATVWFVLMMGGRLLGPWPVRGLPAIVLATSVGFVIMARQVMFDALLAATMTAGLVLFWMASEKKTRALVYGAYAALALGVLTKGLMGFLLPAMVVLAYCAIARDWERLRPMASAGGIALFLALAVPWHVAAALRHHEFLWFYFVNEHLLRFLGRRQPPDFPHKPPWTPALGVVFLTLPWSALFPALVFYLASLPKRDTRLRPEMVFVLCWAIVPLAFFTLSRSRIYYMLPVVPPFALLVGCLWADVTAGGGLPRLRRWIFGSLLLSFILVLLAWLWCGERVLAGGKNYDRLALAFVSCSFLVAGLGAAVVTAFKHDFGKALSCVAAGCALTIAVAAVAVTYWPAGESYKGMAEAANGLARNHDVVVALDNLLERRSSFLFYLDSKLRPVLVVDGREGGDLQFGSRFPEARHLFITGDDLVRLGASKRILVVTEGPLRSTPPPGLQVVMRYRKYILWANFSP